MNEIVAIKFVDLCKNCVHMGLQYCEDSHCEVESFCKVSGLERKLCDSEICPLIYRGTKNGKSELKDM